MAGLNRDEISELQLSRRALLRAGVAVPLSAAFLAACGSSGASTAPTAAPTAAATAAPTAAATAAPTAAPTAAAENFAGTTIVVSSRGAGFDDTGMFKKAKADWEARTGGKVEFQVFSAFGDFDIKYAGYVTSQDPAVDLLYTYEAFTQTYGPRLYADLSAEDQSDYVPGTISTAKTLDGVFRALPAQSEMVIFAFNKKMFADAGIDPDNVPKTWTELYGFTDKLKSGIRYPHASSILSAGHALPWFLTYYNSTPSPLLSEDRTKLMFDNQDFKDSLQVFMDGVDAGFYDPDALYLASSYDHTKIWYEGNAASTTTFAELIVTGLDPAQSKISDQVGVAVMPGVKAGGGTGTFNGYEAFALNQFSTKKEAALSFAREMAGFASQKSIALGENFTALPPSRLSVFEDPDVKAKYVLAPILFEQAKSNTNRWGAPYFSDMSAVFDDVLPKMQKKELTVDAAYTQLVERVQKVIDDFNAA